METKEIKDDKVVSLRKAEGNAIEEIIEYLTENKNELKDVVIAAIYKDTTSQIVTSDIDMRDYVFASALIANDVNACIGNM